MTGSYAATRIHTDVLAPRVHVTVAGADREIVPGNTTPASGGGALVVPLNAGTPSAAPAAVNTMGAPGAKRSSGVVDGLEE